MYEDKTETEYHMYPLYGCFLDRHDEFEFLIKGEKKRQRRIKKCFTLIDLIVASTLLSIYATLDYYTEWTAWHPTTAQITAIVESLFEISTGCLLVWSALFLTKTIRTL